jgi:hypothetical protein
MVHKKHTKKTYIALSFFLLTAVVLTSIVPAAASPAADESAVSITMHINSSRATVNQEQFC